MASLNRRFRTRLSDIPLDRAAMFFEEEPEYFFEDIDLNEEEAEINYYCCCGRCMGQEYSEFDLLEWVEKVRPWVKTDDPTGMRDLLEGVLLEEGDRRPHGWNVDSREFYCTCCCEDHWTSGCYFHDPSLNGGLDLPAWEAWAEEVIRRRNDPLRVLARSIDN